MAEFDCIHPKVGSISIAETYSRDQIKQRFTVWCAKTTKYRVYESVDDFIKILSNRTQQLYYNEVIWGSTQKLKFDIDLTADELADISGEATNATFDQNINVLNDIIKDTFVATYHRPLDPTHIIVCKSDDPKGIKYSAHIVLLYAVVDHLEAAEFTKRILIHHTAKLLLDAGVNKSIQNFRIANCAKPDGRIKHIITPGVTIRQTLITQCDEIPILPKLLGDTLQPTPSAPINEKTITEVLDMVKLANITDHVFRRHRNGLFEFRRVKASHCQHCQREHAKDNTMIITVAPTGGVFISCRKSTGGSLLLGTLSTAEAFVAQAQEEQVVKLLSIPPAKYTTKFDTLPLNIVYSEPKIRPFELCDTLCVHAAMKMGKTKALMEYIKLLPADAIIRFVSFRVTFSGNIKSSFTDFTLYSDHNTTFDHTTKKLIIQVESLHRLQITKGSPPPDLLILDESEAILEQFGSGLLREFVLCWSAFTYLLKYSKRVIALDALMSDRTYNTLARVRFGDQPAPPITYHRNAYENAHADTIYITPTKLKWLAVLYSAIDSDEKIAVPMSSLIEAKILYTNLCKKYPGKQIKMYSSESSSADRKHFSDVHAYWAVDVLIYTPTISAGVSFEIAHFDKVFAYFSDASCPVETCIQMIGRIRDVALKTLFICISAWGADLPVTADLIEQSLHTNRENLVRSFDETGLIPNYGPTGEVVYHRSDYFYLWVDNIISKNKSKNAFIERFSMLISVAGATCKPLTDEVATEYTGFAYTPEAFADIAEAHNNTRAELKESSIGAVVGAPDITTEDVNIIQQKKISGEDITPDEKAAYDRYRLRQDYQFTGEITPKFVQTYADAKQRHRAKNLVKLKLGYRVDIDRIQQEEQRANKYLMSSADTHHLDLTRKYMFDKHRLAMGLIYSCTWTHLYDPELKPGHILQTAFGGDAYVSSVKYIATTFEIKPICASSLAATRGDSELFIKAHLKFINNVLGIMYGAKIYCVEPGIYSIQPSKDFARSESAVRPHIQIDPVTVVDIPEEPVIVLGPADIFSDEQAPKDDLDDLLGLI